jgi:hypothetical protein
VVPPLASAACRTVTVPQRRVSASTAPSCPRCPRCLGAHGAINVDPSQIDPDAPVAFDLNNDAVGGWRAFVAEVARRRVQLPAVKWQNVGPVSLGLALIRGGVEAELAFRVAANAVAQRLHTLGRAVARVAPATQQIVFIDEPDFRHITDERFPIAPDAAWDLVSGAMATAGQYAAAGVHVCHGVDIPSMLATGPSVLSLPVNREHALAAGYLHRFLDAGGVIAWGVVPTDGPIPTTADRQWKRLCALWCDLVQRGVDPAMLRTQSLVSPECGLGPHSPAVAERVFRLVNEVGARVGDQASAVQWALGS